MDSIHWVFVNEKLNEVNVGAGKGRKTNKKSCLIT